MTRGSKLSKDTKEESSSGNNMCKGPEAQNEFGRFKEQEKRGCGYTAV